MKNQLTSLLFCALLSTTLAHEYFARRHLSEQAKSLGSQNEEGHFLTEQRLSLPKNCTVVCEPVPVTGGLNFYIHAEVNLVALLNVTANVAIVIDLNLGLVATFNGTSGVTIVINIETKEGYQINKGPWNQGQKFEAFFESLTSLKVVWELGVKSGTKFTLQSASSATLNIVLQILIALKVEVSGGASNSLKVLIEISVQISGALKSGILKGLGKLNIEISGSLQWLSRTLKALTDLIGSLPGGLEGLTSKGVHLKLDVLLTLGSGIEILVYVLVEINGKIDVSAAFGDKLSDFNKALQLIIELGGKELSGVTGIFIILQNLIAYLDKKIDLNQLIEILIFYTISVKSDNGLKEQFVGSLYALIVILTQINATAYKQVITILTSLKDGNYVYKGVNVSSILELLFTASGRGALVVVISILLSLEVAVSASVALAALFLVILNLLVTSGGVIVIVAFTGVQISFEAGGNVVSWIIKQLSGLKITQIIGLLLSGQVEQAISKIPIIGDIYVAFGAALKVSSNGSISTTVIFGGSGQAGQAIGGFIKQLLQGSISVGGSAQVSATYGVSISS